MQTRQIEASKKIEEPETRAPEDTPYIINQEKVADVGRELFT